jgi:hypothetical protein
MSSVNFLLFSENSCQGVPAQKPHRIVIINVGSAALLSFPLACLTWQHFGEEGAPTFKCVLGGLMFCKQAWSARQSSLPGGAT